MNKEKEVVQHIENQFIFEAGSHNTIIKDSTFNAPVYTCRLKEEDNDDQCSNLELALQHVAEMAKDGFFKIQKNYIAPYRFIEEKYAPGIETSEFCRLMESTTGLSNELLPKNDNIRKIYYDRREKFPNWTFPKENVEWSQNMVDIAKELQKRIKSREI